ncbi:outer membrane beta-barrel protein [Winogradskyella sp.]|uniref:outer membrane beta-barrel protein n=1 Tax=Winogradskyella sp. TaxID=1883156 RepID=UPI0025F209D8|nr:outer membrane beta-barrel protein [Winogradskyella sp.]
MKNCLITFLFIFSTSSIFAQDDYKESGKKGNWIITNQFGIATLEAEDFFKVRASVFEGAFSREFFLNEKFSIVTGLEFLRVKADFQDLDNKQQHISNNHINLPLSVKFYNNKSDKIALFAEVGLYGSYLYESKVENIFENETQKQKKLGFNFGQHFIAGLRFKLDKKYSASLGFKYKSDFSSSYSDSKQQFELTEYYAVQLGLYLVL